MDDATKTLDKLTSKFPPHNGGGRSIFQPVYCITPGTRELSTICRKFSSKEITLGQLKVYVISDERCKRQLLPLIHDDDVTSGLANRRS